MGIKKQIMAELDNAIDRMDMDAIDKNLLELSFLETDSVIAEDPALFSLRIMKLSEEKDNMNTKRIRKPAKLIIAAALIALMGVSVYAAVTMNLFSFQSGDRFVTLRTTESMTEQEAKDFVGEDEDSTVPDDGQAEANNPAQQDYGFGSVEEAESSLDMDIIVPSAMPEMKLDSATGTKYAFGDSREQRIVWLEYSDAAGRRFGITTTREIVKPGEAFTSYTMNDIDEGSLGSYKSKSGIEYSTLTESDETGEMTANIAVTMQGEYEYALVFVGFDEKERQQIIDSADLSAYHK